MGKRNDLGNFWLIVIAVIAAPFVFLWEKIGPLGFLVILGVAVFLWVRSIAQKNKQEDKIDAITVSSKPVMQKVMADGELTKSYIENDGNGGINVVYETRPQVIVESGGVAVSAQMFVRSRRNSRISVLHREATQLKDSGEWDKAIAALQEAQELMRKSDDIDTIERWLRLPIFLQQGGRFDEAMQEFNRLLDELNDRTAREFSHQPEFIQRGATHHQRAAIYNKMKVACKRQKLPEKAAKYEKLRDECLEKHQKYMEERDIYWKEQSALREAKRAERRAELDKKP